MKSILVKIILCCLLLVCGGHLRAQELDSLKQKALAAKMDEYFVVMEKEGIPVQIQECDFLIESATDPLVRQFVAQRVYDHYIASPVMGSEAVAIHVLDKWFIPGTVRMADEIAFINARVYADFNRQSLLGMKAPALMMKDHEGVETELFGTQASDGRFKVLYFYDTDCSKCKIETILLRNVLEDKNYPIDLYAVYSGSDRQAWDSYRDRQLTIEAPQTTVIHLWDPEVDSDFQRKYGVLQTPRMFLIGPDGTILGRGLDTEALVKLLRPVFTKVELNYGGDASVMLFDGILASEDGLVAPSVEQVTRLSDYIQSATLSQGDTTMFRQLSGDLLYYLASRTGEGFKEGLKHLIDNNIKAFPKAWNSPDDSLKVIGFADIMYDLLSKAQPSSMIPDIKIPAQRIAKGKAKEGNFKLAGLKGDTNVIMFYTQGCEICKAEKEALNILAAQDRKMVVLLVNVDAILAERPELAERLFDSFDLSTLPFILSTDRNGVIQRRYLSYR